MLNIRIKLPGLHLVPCLNAPARGVLRAMVVPFSRSVCLPGYGLRLFLVVLLLRIPAFAGMAGAGRESINSARTEYQYPAENSVYF